MPVVSGATTFLDYTVVADGSETAGSLSVNGFLTDGTTRLNFDIAARGASGSLRAAFARIARRVMERPALFAFAGGAARVVGRALPAPWLARLTVPWTRGRELPELPRESFHTLYAKRRRASE